MTCSCSETSARPSRLPSAASCIASKGKPRSLSWTRLVALRCAPSNLSRGWRSSSCGLTQKSTQRRVALKRLHDTDDPQRRRRMLERFEREFCNASDYRRRWHRGDPSSACARQGRERSRVLPSHGPHAPLCFDHRPETLATKLMSGHGFHARRLRVLDQGSDTQELTVYAAGSGYAARGGRATRCAFCDRFLI
jgi:hypothetical protein